ncbi:MAG: hypothetical protein ABSH34_36550 [Verrucomicrobiota bacterium]|jgi:hypothetical protein
MSYYYNQLLAGGARRRTAMDWTERAASSSVVGLPQDGINAAAKEMQRADPARFPSVAQAVEA